MSEKNLQTALAYYGAMAEKNVSGLEQYLHPDVHFIGPLADFKGKQGVLDAAKGFMQAFKTLTMRAKFERDDQVMLVFDLDCPAPIGIFRGANMMTITNNLITRMELFYDASPFEKKKEEIFSNAMGKE